MTNHPPTPSVPVAAGKTLGVAALDKGTQVGTKAVHVAGDVTHKTIEKVRLVAPGHLPTSSTLTLTSPLRTLQVTNVATPIVHRAGNIASSGLNMAVDKVTAARRRVRRYLKDGWGAGGGGADEAGTSQGGADDAADDEEGADYASLLHFEKAAEITVAAGAQERLPFVLEAGTTVSWEFRVKVCRKWKSWGFRVKVWRSGEAGGTGLVSVVCVASVSQVK